MPHRRLGSVAMFGQRLLASCEDCRAARTRERRAQDLVRAAPEEEWGPAPPRILTSPPEQPPAEKTGHEGQAGHNHSSRQQPATACRGCTSVAAASGIPPTHRVFALLAVFICPARAPPTSGTVSRCSTESSVNSTTRFAALSHLRQKLRQAVESWWPRTGRRQWLWFRTCEESGGGHGRLSASWSDNSHRHTILRCKRPALTFR